MLIPQRIARSLLAITVPLFLFGCCTGLNPDRWSFAGNLKQPGEWKVLYSNQVADRLDTLSIVNCTRQSEGAAARVELVLAREDPIRPPEPYPDPPPPKETRLYEPSYDLSVVGSRRLLVVESGRRLAARATGGRACLYVRLVSTRSVSLGTDH
jgi:hypothetical protein